MERYKEIERSIIKTYRSRLWSKFIKAIKEYELIKPGDRICVCISGGKDSFLMAKLFQELLRHSDFAFEVEYLVMDPGYNKKNLEVIKKNLELLNIPAIIKSTDIFEITSNISKNPCYLCAKMRRGALYNLAKKLNCNKIALGHHYDDVIVTTLMNMLNSGSFQTMLPKLHSQNYKGMELIRPMYYIRERDILNWKKYNNLEFIACACKLTSKLENEELSSQRAFTKKLIDELVKTIPQVEDNIFSSALNVNVDKILGYKINDKRVSFLDDYDTK